MFDAVADSYEPPPVRRTAPLGNPVALPLKPTAALPELLKAASADSVGIIPSLQAMTMPQSNRHMRGITTRDFIMVSSVEREAIRIGCEFIRNDRKRGRPPGSAGGENREEIVGRAV
jgi:hypothetical protein